MTTESAQDPTPISPDDKLRILVTGGTGLIGRPLVARLAAAGHDLVVLTRDPDRAEPPPGARAVGWDAETAEGWGELVDGDTVIVHLAGESVASGRWTEEKKEVIRCSRVHSSEAVRQAVEGAATPPRALLQASAVGYYGDRGDEVLTEDAESADPESEDDFLAEVAREWEGATAAVEALGVRRVVLRTGVVLAKDGGALPRMALPFKIFLGGPLGGGRQWVPWIHLEDEVRAVVFLLERAARHVEGIAGPFNLTAPEPVTNRQLSKAIARTLARPCWFPAPETALHLAMGEMAEMVLASQRAVPRRLEKLGFEFRYPRIASALEDLLG